MTGDWLGSLRRALDNASRPVRIFFRDDDVGWGNERLFELLDLFARYSLPLDLAVIPTELTLPLSTRLTSSIEAAPAPINVHQHGYAHVNHEPLGRKCEFGPARCREDQRRDIALGAQRIRDLLGPIARPIFTPPWNRCTAETGRCLVELGFRVLSCAASTPPLDLPGLIEIPIRVDWFAKRKGQRLSRTELGTLLAGEVERAPAVGVMFHHALMDADEMQAAEELFALLAGHERSDCRPMLTLAEEQVSLA